MKTTKYHCTSITDYAPNCCGCVRLSNENVNKNIYAKD